MKPKKGFEAFNRRAIEDAKGVFGYHSTCKRKIAPKEEEYEVAVIPWKNVENTFDNIQVCLIHLPATFLTAYIRNGEKRVLAIKTRSGSVKDLWGLVKPILVLMAVGDIGFKSYDEKTEDGST